MKTYFVRHGQTNYNVEGLCNDDPSKKVYLTDFGKKQSEVVAEKLKDKKFEVIYISELPRTKETADTINKHHNVLIKIDKRINDTKTGFESKTFIGYQKAIEKDRFNIKLNEGESFQEEKQRVFNFLEYLKKQNYKSVHIVSHSEIMQIVNGYFNNLSDEGMVSTKIDNSQVLQFNI